VKRREFIAGLGGAAAWPLAARAQQTERVRRIGFLLYGDEDDPDEKARLSAFMQSFAQLGWTDGRNLLMDIRWTAADLDRARKYANELVGLQPDVILAEATPLTAALHRETRTIPIVFVGISDPVGAGFVASLPRPGGNLTGFINIEAAMGSKWLELLLEIAPGVKRVAIMFSSDTATGTYYVPSFEAAARKLEVEPVAAAIRSVAEIETVAASIGRTPGGGLVLPPDSFTTTRRAPIILAAARNDIPAVYSDSVFAKGGGLLSYGPDRLDIFHRSASYVDRILRGAKPADLPVQVPVKFEMALNVKTAKALGLTVPQTLLLAADEVIE
jgi:putative tryptophan/tyrosine transport system substrate-binding protein